MKNQNVKKRNWCFILYPESCPEDYIDQLKQSGLSYSISPLHDKDTEADGVTPKKPHYHVIVVYGSPTTYNNVKSLTDRLNCPIPQALEQVRGYFRYFTHMDNPEKFQYDAKYIISGNGFNISDFVEMSKSEVLKTKKELQKLIRDLDITEYKDFIDYIQDFLAEEDRFFDVACNNTIFFNTYIKSNKFSKSEKQRNDI